MSERDLKIVARTVRNVRRHGLQHRYRRRDRPTAGGAADSCTGLKYFIRKQGRITGGTFTFDWLVGGVLLPSPVTCNFDLSDATLQADIENHPGKGGATITCDWGPITQRDIIITLSIVVADTEPPLIDSGGLDGDPDACITSGSYQGT